MRCVAFQVSRGIRCLLPTLPLALLLPIGSSSAQVLNAPARSAPVTADFTLPELLGHTWRNEAVRFPLTAAQVRLAKSGRVLRDSANQPVAYQLSPTTRQPTSIEFLADLDPWKQQRYQFGNSGKAPATDLKVEENAESIRLTNHRVGISLRKRLKVGQGPIESIRLASGKWVGASLLDPKLPSTTYSARVLTRGPVSSEVECRVGYSASSTWTLRFRLTANEPAVLVDEEMNLGGQSSRFSLTLSDNFQPDRVFYRQGVQNTAGPLGMNLVSEVKPGNIFVLEPWLRWYIQPNQGSLFSLFQSAGNDLLSIGAREAGAWVDPNLPEALRTPPQAVAIQDEQGLHLDFVLKNGRRKWMIAALDKSASLAGMDDPKQTSYSSLPYQYLIKHGHFPLNTVKDYVLSWKGGKESYPHLLVTPEQIQRFRASLKEADRARYEAAIPGYLQMEINQYNSQEPITAYFATGNEALGKHLAAAAEKLGQFSVDTFLVQAHEPYGSAPHHHSFLGVVPLLADAVLSSPNLPSATRERLLAQMAFVGYALNRPDYWSPERGYGANPNMTTSVQGYKTAIACAIPSHPRAAEWARNGVAGLKNQLDTWSDENGGWLEAPHYAMVAFDQILSAFVMTHNSGFNDYLYDPRVKNVANWFSKISSPPDARAQGRRHMPPLGNSYIGEPSGMFGIVAALWKERDPQFAGEMQWMYRQQGSWPSPGLGGFFPGFAGYRTLLLDPSLPEAAPKYESEIFPNTGVNLRAHFPSERETYLHLLAGSFHGDRGHWDDDSGSLTLWGKGRILADDFGYYGRAPADDHSLLDAPEVRQNPIFNVEQFVPSTFFDYVSGARGPWQRQIAFLKDADPLAPNYFVLSETTKTTAPGILRLWLTAAKVTPTGNKVLVEGKEDVDTDLFFATPLVGELKTESRTRTSGSGINPQGIEGATPTTQIGLIATTPPEGETLYVIYPRLKTEKPPLFTALAGGKGVRVESAAGVDYVFQSATPFTYQEGPVTFRGKSGVVKRRGKKLVLGLGEGGSIQAFGQQLEATKATQKEVELPE